MIEMNRTGFMPVFVHDMEEAWRRALELAEERDKENEEGLEKKDFVWGDLYEDRRI